MKDKNNFRKMLLLLPGLLFFTLVSGSCNYFDPLAAAGMKGLAIYWTEQTSINKADINGGSKKQIQSSGGTHGAIALDKLNGAIYWVDTIGFTGIHKSGLDGSGDQRITYINAVALAVDTINGKIYYATGMNIFRCNLDGTGETNLYSFGFMVNDLALDLKNNEIYWAESGYVCKSSLAAGTLSRNIINSGNSFSKLDIDVESGKLILYESAIGFFYSLDKNGGSLTALKSGLTPVEDLVLDPYKDRIYYAEGMQIKRMDWNGSNTTTLVDLSASATNARGLALDLWP